jgi:hypothetical protein
MVIDHIDRNKLNNNVENLRYVTQQVNCCNTDAYIVEIEETDLEKRKKLLCKRYAEKNKEKVSQYSKLYYETNKKIVLEKQKNNKIDVVCSECNVSRTMTKCNYNRNNRLGVNVCKKCSSIKNLPV